MKIYYFNFISLKIFFRSHVFNGQNGPAVHQIVVGEPNQDHVVRIEKSLNVGVGFVQILASGVTGDNSSNHVPKVYFYFSNSFRKGCIKSDSINSLFSLWRISASKTTLSEWYSRSWRMSRYL